MGEGTRRANREATIAEQAAVVKAAGDLAYLAAKEATDLAAKMSKPDPDCDKCNGEGIEGKPCDLCWQD